jgi:uncharacterized protein YbgA (DUF1722 family)/uncharacterized protein YbbK (DUF523 family)
MPEEIFSPKPKLGISACLLGEKVRYDGGDRKDYFLTETFGRHVQWVPVCPEVEIGMGIPREAVRLVGDPVKPRMIAERSGKDWTPQFNAFAGKRVQALTALDLAGYIFKKDSPSCGMERVRVYSAKGVPTRQGRGLFAAAIMRTMLLLPVEEEGRLNDWALRENFVERVFAYHHWQRLARGRRSISSLVDFHTRHKFLLLAHSERHYRKLGRIVAEIKHSPVADAHVEYGHLFMEGLAIHATVKKHCNVLRHMMGYFSKELSPAEREELIGHIIDFRHNLVPLVVPLTLVRHYVNKFDVGYLQRQVYLQPSPKELLLLNHV